MPGVLKKISAVIWWSQQTLARLKTITPSSEQETKANADIEEPPPNKKV